MPRARVITLSTVNIPSDTDGSDADDDDVDITNQLRAELIEEWISLYVHVSEHQGPSKSHDEPAIVDLTGDKKAPEIIDLTGDDEDTSSQDPFDEIKKLTDSCFQEDWVDGSRKRQSDVQLIQVKRHDVFIKISSNHADPKLRGAVGVSLNVFDEADLIDKPINLREPKMQVRLDRQDIDYGPLSEGQLVKVMKQTSRFVGQTGTLLKQFVINGRERCLVKPLDEESPHFLVRKSYLVRVCEDSSPYILNDLSKD